jgi:hypothetical protein
LPECVPLVECLNHSRGWTVGKVCVGDGCAGGVPESWSVRRWVGVREMGLGAKWCVLDPT